MTSPRVYNAVRSVGILTPEIEQSPQGLVFANKMRVVGTAFWLKQAKVLVTCAHVIQRQDLLVGSASALLYVGRGDGRVDRATIDVIGFGYDLAVLRLVDATPEHVEGEAATGLDIVDRIPPIGTPVAYAGYPYGDQLLRASRAPTYAEGIVGSSLRPNGARKEIQITGPVAGGYSGSPVVLKADPEKVVGVLSNGPNDANIFMAISWEHLVAIRSLILS